MRELLPGLRNDLLYNTCEICSSIPNLYRFLGSGSVNILIIAQINSMLVIGMIPTRAAAID